MAISDGVEAVILIATFGFQESCITPSVVGATVFNIMLPALAGVIPVTTQYTTNFYTCEYLGL